MNQQAQESPTALSSSRKMIHKRKIEVIGYQLENNLFEIEANLLDIRGHDMNLTDRNGLLTAGEPLHQMTLTLTIDSNMLIIKADAITHNSPYHLCKKVNPNYLSLVGITIGPGWNRKIKAVVGTQKGCTHLNEMLAQMATVAFQTVWGSTPFKEELDARMLNTCFSYQEDSEVILRLLRNKT